jgi:alpha-beta hydrolase superfamily lysophospholipase
MQDCVNNKVNMTGRLLTSFLSLTCLLAVSMPVDAAADSKTSNSASTSSSSTADPVLDLPDGAQKSDLLPNQPPLLVWSPASSTATKGVVLCLHELGMHSGVFADLGKRLSDKGYIVYAMDERGFGGWEKMKGSESHMNLDRILGDIKEASLALHKKHDGLPLFLLGEAMGGTLVLKAAATNPELIQGTISSTPGGEHFNTGRNYMTVCKHLVTAPSKRFPMGKSLIAAGTPVQEQQDYLQNEAKVRINLSPKELMACQFFMYKANNFASRIKTTPVMIVQGNRDGETKPISSQHVYDHLATSDKKMMMVPDGDHYVYEGKHVNDGAMKDTLAWLDSHLPTK